MTTSTAPAFKLSQTIQIEGLRSSTASGSVIANVLRIVDFNGNRVPDLFVSKISWADMGETTQAPILILDFLTSVARPFELQAAGVKLKTSFVARVVSGDFNHDAFDDLFLIESGPDKEPYVGGVSFFVEGASDNPRVITTANLPKLFNHGAAAGDINRDGFDDLFVVTGTNQINQSGNYIALRSQDSSASSVVDLTKIQPTFNSNYPWNPTYQVVQGALSTTISDINADGLMDYVLGGDPVTIFFGDGRGGFLSKTPVLIPIEDYFKGNEAIVSLTTINLNGDTYPDLLVGVVDHSPENFYGDFRIEAFVSNRGTAFTNVSKQVLPSEVYWWPQSTKAPRWNVWPKELVTSDADRDGDDDIFIISDGGGVQLLLNEAGRFSVVFDSIRFLSSGTSPEKGLRDSTTVADINGDGLPDIIQTNGFEYYLLPKSTGISIWLNQLKSGGIYKARFDGGDLRGSPTGDSFFPSQFADYIEGGGGLDYIQYFGRRSDYMVTVNRGDTLVTEVERAWNRDALKEIERLQFIDATLGIDIAGNAGQAYRVYKAAFNRDPMNGDKGGLGYWIAQIDKGMDLIEVSARFVDSNEFRTLYGTHPTNDQFLTKLYTNVLGRQPEASGYNWWLNQLNTNPEKTKAKVLADFAESAENQTGVLGLIGSGITYEPWVG